VHILDEIAIGAVFVLATALLHILSLVYLYFYMSKTFQKTNGEQYSAVQIVKILSIVIFFILMIHTIEAWLWACLYWFLGEFSDFGQALYFSVVTSTTLGYGDVTLSEQWQLLGSCEAMGGLILFAVSTAFLIDVVNELFKNPLK